MVSKNSKNVLEEDKNIDLSKIDRGMENKKENEALKESENQDLENKKSEKIEAENEIKQGFFESGNNFEKTKDFDDKGNKEVSEANDTCQKLTPPYQNLTSPLSKIDPYKDINNKYINKDKSIHQKNNINIKFKENNTIEKQSQEKNKNNFSEEKKPDEFIGKYKNIKLTDNQKLILEEKYGKRIDGLIDLVSEKIHIRTTDVPIGNFYKYIQQIAFQENIRTEEELILIKEKQQRNLFEKAKILAKDGIIPTEEEKELMGESYFNECVKIVNNNKNSEVRKIIEKLGISKEEYYKIYDRNNYNSTEEWLNATKEFKNKLNLKEI